jgi:hypothetical protein
MNEKLKGCVCLLLGMVNACLLGCYTVTAKPVDTTQWLMASLLMMYFLPLGIEKIRKT